MATLEEMRDTLNAYDEWRQQTALNPDTSIEAFLREQRIRAWDPSLAKIEEAMTQLRPGETISVLVAGEDWASPWSITVQITARAGESE
ncbi:hypothetical protein [Agromyces sp. NPDC058104]|uniref:hypothetical protein n=1 Tax=Agromyces sp. NPDC058104 TaxID=3346342 RepID=UPI0036DAD92F